MADRKRGVPAAGTNAASSRGAQPTAAQKDYLARGLRQPGGKLPLFDPQGQVYSERLIRGCLKRGWAEPWFDNPLKPDWLVCRLTRKGRLLFVSNDV